jgi:hypothetical protein
VRVHVRPTCVGAFLGMHTKTVILCPDHVDNFAHITRVLGADTVDISGYSITFTTNSQEELTRITGVVEHMHARLHNLGM